MGLSWAKAQSSQPYQGQAQRRPWQNAGWWSQALHSVPLQADPAGDVWTLMIPGGAMPAAMCLCPGPRGTG